jgi:hypothetical protein
MTETVTVYVGKYVFNLTIKLCSCCANESLVHLVDHVTITSHPSQLAQSVEQDLYFMAYILHQSFNLRLRIQ